VPARGGESRKGAELDAHRMLIVDDEPSARRAIRRIFAGRGWDVAEAGTVADGLEALTSGLAPDCLVLDLMLPDGDGEEVLQWIRTGGLPTRVIVTTGVGDPARLGALARLRPDSVIRKPIEADEVCRAAGLDPAGASPGPTSSPSRPGPWASSLPSSRSDELPVPPVVERPSWPGSRSGEYTIPTGRSGESPISKGRPGDYTIPTGRSGEFPIPTGRSGSTPIPSNRLGEYTIPSGRSGESPVPPSRSGESAVPPNRSGETALPTGRSGEFGPPAGRSGEFGLPTSRSGELGRPPGRSGEAPVPPGRSGEAPIPASPPTSWSGESPISFSAPSSTTGYHSDASKEDRVRPSDIPRRVPVLDRIGGSPIGEATQVGFVRGADGRSEALWKLVVHGDAVAGSFALRGGEFLPIGGPADKKGRW
jgi:CheY-like chemotaxis protein